MPKMKTEKKPLAFDPLHWEILKFVQMVMSISPTDPDWKGKGVAVTLMQMVASDSQREAVNDIGKLHGCHSCLTPVATDKNQPWIGDHQPPTELSAKARKALGLAEAPVYDGSVKLRPQCDVCSVSQAATVKRINAEVAGGKEPNLNALGKRLLGVAKPKHDECINASSAKVSPAEGDSIQRLGEVHGCHSCGTYCPKDAYHADHCPPYCYTRSHVIKILKYAQKNVKSLDKLEIPTEFELRPQCPRCSHEQGGKLREVAGWAKRLAEALGITVY